MKIRFLVDRTVDDHRKGTPEEESYKVGQIVDLPEPSAMRWINRNAAAAHVDGPEQAAPMTLADLPEGWRDLKSAPLQELARRLGADETVNTKAEATAYIEAVIKAGA